MAAVSKAILSLSCLAAASAFVAPTAPRATALRTSSRSALRAADDDAEALPDLQADIARFRAAQGGDEAGAAPVVDQNDALKADIERFRQTQVLPEAAAAGPIQSVVNVLGTVLSVNFVVIVGLFLWFLSGVFSLYALDNDAIIIAVKAAFDPFILPLLSTHMGLTFLSYGLEKTFGEGDPDDDGGFRL